MNFCLLLLKLTQRRTVDLTIATVVAGLTLGLTSCNSFSDDSPIAQQQEPAESTQTDPVTEEPPADMPSAIPAENRPGDPTEQAPLTDDEEKQLREHFNLAQNELTAGNHAGAAEHFTNAAELIPTNRKLLHSLADCRFMAGDIAGAIQAYDKLIELRPAEAPYLWQRGLALYYADEFAEGKKQFETHQNVNTQDVENAVWHLLCAARIEELEEARQRLIPIARDRRPWASDVYELFAGRLDPEDLKMAVPPEENMAGFARENSYYSNLYLGLYYEMIGNKELCEKHLTDAASLNSYGSQVLMGQIANIHLRLREAQSAATEANGN